MRRSWPDRRWRGPALLATWLAVALASGSAAAQTIRIEIDGVDRAIADNIRGFLTLGRYAERTDVTDAQVRRLADRAVDEAADALRPFGFYEPVIRSRTSRDDARWIVRLKVKPGEPVLVKSVDVQIKGPGAEHAALNGLAAASPLQPGSRLEHASYDRLRNDLLRTALDNGFLDARLTRRELVVNPVERTASAHLELDTGGLYRFGTIEIEQDVLRDELLERFVRFEPGRCSRTTGSAARSLRSRTATSSRT
jgi:translocation and assembly module TamA